MCAALYDAEPCLGDTRRSGGMPGALALVQVVMQRVRARGLRAQDQCEAENWTAALPGMQGQELKTEKDSLCFLADALYAERRELVREVLPRLGLDRALALADALVIVETAAPLIRWRRGNGRRCNGARPVCAGNGSGCAQWTRRT